MTRVSLVVAGALVGAWLVLTLSSVVDYPYDVPVKIVILVALSSFALMLASR